MSARDRLVITVLAAAALVACAYLAVVSPERDRAARAAVALTAAQTRRDGAIAQVAAARAAQASFAGNVEAVAQLTQAVPPSDDVAALLDELERTGHRDGVDFRTLKVTPPTSATPPAGALPATTYSLDFSGDFLHLERFLADVHGFTRVAGAQPRVTGRLVNVTSLKLGPSQDQPGRMEASVTAMDYTLPAGQAPAQLIASISPPATPIPATSPPATPIPATSTPVPGTRR